MYRLNYCQPGALPPFRAFALTAREGLVALPRVSLPSVAGPGLQALPPAEVEGWPSAILNAAYGAYTMETICGTTHCDCLPDSNNRKTDGEIGLAVPRRSIIFILTHPPRCQSCRSPLLYVTVHRSFPNKKGRAYRGGHARPKGVVRLRYGPWISRQDSGGNGSPSR